MVKTLERETSTSIVCTYQTDTICSMESLSLWYSRLSCQTIAYIEISDSNGSFLEGDKCLEFASGNIPSDITKYINEIGADTVLIRLIYQGKSFSICVHLSTYEISIASHKENRDTLRILADALSFTNGLNGTCQKVEDKLCLQNGN